MRTDHGGKRILRVWKSIFGIRDLTQGGGGDAGFVKTQNNLRETEIVFYRGSGVTNIRAQDADFFPLCQEFGKSPTLAAKAKSNRRAFRGVSYESINYRVTPEGNGILYNYIIETVK